MTSTLPREVVAGAATSSSPRWLGAASLGLAAVALAGALVPFASVAAGTVGLVGLLAGVFCLVRDPRFNRVALAGSVLSSAAVTIAIVVTIVHAVTR